MASYQNESRQPPSTAPLVPNPNGVYDECIGNLEAADPNWMGSYQQQQRSRQKWKEEEQVLSLDEDGLCSYNDDDDNDGLLTTLKGRLLLLIVAFLYGSLNVTLRLVYQQEDPPSASALSASRGWLAVLCFLPLVVKHQQQQQQQPSTRTRESPEVLSSSSSVSLSTTRTARQGTFWRVAAELALFNFGAQGLLNLGLLSTESARASFFTQTSVVMTPVLSAMAGQRVHRRVWIACIVTLLGVLLLSAPFSSSYTFSFGFGVGDLLCLSGAFCWSCYVFRLSTIGGDMNEIMLQAGKTLILGLLYSSWFSIAQWQHGTSLWPGWTHLITWALIFYSAIGPGTFADIIQQKGQGVVSAAEANIILSLEPVFTALLGFALLHESPPFHEILGGSLIIAASVISSTQT